MAFDAPYWGGRIIEEVSSVQTVVSLFETESALVVALELKLAMEDDERNEIDQRLRQWESTRDQSELSPLPWWLGDDWHEDDSVKHYAESAGELVDVKLGALTILPESRSARLSALMKGYETFRRQVVVLAVTYVELITEDFLKCAFTHCPKSMYSYLNQMADQKGKIDLREVLDAESKEALLDSLALKSARIASQGKFRVLAKNIESITRGKFQAGLVDEIEAIIERRNRLVHEDGGDTISPAEAVAALQSTIKLACDLARIALQCGIPATPWDLMGEDGVNIEYSYEIDGQLARSHAPGQLGIKGSHSFQIFRRDVDNWISSVRCLGIESIICLLDTGELDLYRGLPATLLDYYREAGFHVRHIPAAHRQHPPLTAEQLSDVWLAYQKLPKPVLVHCCDGWDRTDMAIKHIQEQLSRA